MSLGSSSRFAGLFIVLALALVVAGCLSDEPPESEEITSDEAFDGEERESESPDSGQTGAAETAANASEWRLEFTVEPTYEGVFNGVPFDRFTGVGSYCDTFTGFVMPDNATSISTHLYGSASPPGAGYMIHTLHQHDPSRPVVPTPAGEFYVGEPQTSHWVNVTDPESGEWLLVVYPHGPTVDQTWTLDIVIAGEGRLGDTDLDSPNPLGGDCDGDTGEGVHRVQAPIDHGEIEWVRSEDRDP